ncbi:MAG: hypothetical protein IT428_22055 [Planctomycetaceae bacterium]|nr:hypothetical protein [Planctomycetaceae bacterium]
MQWIHYASFFREFFRQPMQLGTFLPSSPFLERRVVRLAELEQADVAVELGAGVGGITSRALECLPKRSTLLAVELSPPLARVLRTWKDPRLIVHEGSAGEFRDVLKASELARPDVIISGIPLAVMPRRESASLLSEAWETLAPGGRLVIYQFRRDVERIAGFCGQPAAVEVEPLNIPPLRVYCWRKPAEVRTRLSARLLRTRVDGPVRTRDRSNDPRRRPLQAALASVRGGGRRHRPIHGVNAEGRSEEPSTARSSRDA